ncbi:hypothetical protein LXL04_019236 [Taraxacum kok-saghyz]
MVLPYLDVISLGSYGGQPATNSTCAVAFKTIPVFACINQLCDLEQVVRPIRPFVRPHTGQNRVIESSHNQAHNINFINPQLMISRVLGDFSSNQPNNQSIDCVEPRIISLG